MPSPSSVVSRLPFHVEGSKVSFAEGDRSKVAWRRCGPCGMEASGGAVVSPDIGLGPLGGCMPRPQSVCWMDSLDIGAFASVLVGGCLP